MPPSEGAPYGGHGPRGLDSPAGRTPGMRGRPVEEGPEHHPLGARTEFGGRPVERTFAFVDLAGFTALAEAHGDDDAAKAARELVEITRDATSPEVQLVKSLGDAVMLAADGPVRMLAALDTLAEAYRPAGGSPALRAGLHHGSAIESESDYYGRAVNLAARVAAVAGPGEAVLTAVVAQPAVVQGMPLEPLGQRRLRNIPDPVDLFLLRLADDDRLVTDPVCRMRVDPAASAARISLDGHDFWFCSVDCVRRFTADPATYT